VREFFADLGIEVEGRTFVEGEMIDTVIGTSFVGGSRTGHAPRDDPAPDTATSCDD
jgi:hypothetical protein